MDNADLADATVLYPDHDQNTTGATTLDAPKLTASGQPDGRSREARAARARAQGSAPPPPATRKAAGTRKPGQAKDYTKGIEGLGQLAAGALFFVAPADAAAVGYHIPPIAVALNDLAREDPRVAALLDKILQVGPYGMLLGAVMPLVLQILTNHGKVPAGMLGTLEPEVLVGAFLSQGSNG